MTRENRNFKIFQAVLLAIAAMVVIRAVVEYPWAGGAVILVAILAFFAKINAGAWPP